MTRKEGAETSPRDEPRVRALPGQRLVNVVVRGLLRTPGLSSLVGSRLLTLYLVGRNSGRRYSVPVAYLADGDDLLLGTSAGWRHKLRLGQPVAVRLRGKHPPAGRPAARMPIQVRGCSTPSRTGTAVRPCYVARTADGADPPLNCGGPGPQQP